MENHISEFLSYIHCEKGLSRNTQESYGRDLNDFLLFLHQNEINKWKSVSQQLVIDFLALKKTQGYATASICRSLISIKVFLKFLKREGVISVNVSALLETPKLWQTIPDILSIEEVEHLLNQPNLKSTRGARDRAILEMLYSTGIRVSELCGIMLYDLDDEFVKIKGKGGKERIIPVSQRAVRAVDTYLGLRESTPNSEKETLFIRKQGLPLSRMTIWKMVRRYAAMAGIQKTITPHTFRHSFATHLLDGGADLRVIQEILGHSNISSTDRYTHVSINHIQTAFHQFHPRG